MKLFHKQSVKLILISILACKKFVGCTTRGNEEDLGSTNHSTSQSRHGMNPLTRISERMTQVKIEEKNFESTVPKEQPFPKQSYKFDHKLSKIYLKNIKKLHHLDKYLLTLLEIVKLFELEIETKNNNENGIFSDELAKSSFTEYRDLVSKIICTLQDISEINKQQERITRVFNTVSSDVDEKFTSHKKID